MTEEIMQCIQAQKKYCEERGAPHFAPYDGRCYRCGRQIYGGGGWNLDDAKKLITGCPHCHYSFCE